jgi:hypothetical protein
MLDSFYLLGQGQWTEAEASGRRAAEAAGRIGNSRSWEEGMLGVANTRYFRGMFEESLALFDAVRESASRGSNQSEAWGWIGISQNYFRLGELELAQQAAERAGVVLTDATSPTSGAMIEVMRSALAARRGDVDLASERADRAAALMHAIPPIHHGLIASYGILADTYLELWALRRGTAIEGDLRRATARCCRALGKLSRLFPIAAPMTLLARGKYLAMRGSHRQASRTWLACATTARRLGMPYEEALAEKALGDQEFGDVDERRGHLAAAQQLFARLRVPAAEVINGHVSQDAEL